MKTICWPQRLRALLVFVAIVLLLVPAWQSRADDPKAGESAIVRQSAPVRVANRTIIQLRGPIAGYTAQERATATTTRIEQILEGQLNPQLSLEDAEEGRATRVLLGGKHAFLVTAVDIDPQAGETTKVVAREAAARLERAILELRETQTPRYLARAVGFSFAFTLIYLLALRAMLGLARWSGRRLSQAAATRPSDVQLSGVTVLNSSQILRVVRWLLIGVTWAVGIAFTVVWLTLVLEQFPYTRPWGEQLGGHLVTILVRVATAIVGAAPGLVVVAVILFLARLVDRICGAFFHRVQTGRTEVGWIDADTAEPTRRIFRLVIWIFAVAMAYPYLPGAETDAFKGLSVLVGLMVSLGAASVIGQAFNGLILMYSRTFRKGDFVRLGDVEGTVADIGLFLTRVRTGLGEEVSMPNSSIMSGSVKNYSRAVPGTGYVVDTVVTIGYSTPWRQVHAMLEEAARRVPEIARTPEPLVRQTALSDFYVEYRLVAYTPVETPRKRVEVLSDLHGHILDVFNEHGVQIMSPHYMADTAAPQVVEKKDWYAAPAHPPGSAGR